MRVIVKLAVAEIITVEEAENTARRIGEFGPNITCPTVLDEHGDPHGQDDLAMLLRFKIDEVLKTRGISKEEVDSLYIKIPGKDGSFLIMAPRPKKT